MKKLDLFDMSDRELKICVIYGLWDLKKITKQNLVIQLIILILILIQMILAIIL